MTLFRVSLAAAVAMLVLPLETAEVEAQAPRRTLCVHDVGQSAGLDVHAEPKPSSRVVGQFAAKACDVRVSGKCAGAWCQMTHGGVTGWVETRHIGVYEVPAEAAASEPAPSEPAPASPPAAGSAAVVRPLPPPSAVAVEPPAPKASAGRPATATAVQRPTRRADVREKPSSRSLRSAKVRERHAEARPRRARPLPQVGYLPPPPWWMPARGWWAPVRMTAPRACVVGVERGDTLRLRTGPGVDHDAIGGIPPGACSVEVAGRCQGAWCRVAWRGREGWVNSNYLN